MTESDGSTDDTPQGADVPAAAELGEATVVAGDEAPAARDDGADEVVEAHAVTASAESDIASSELAAHALASQGAASEADAPGDGDGDGDGDDAGTAVLPAADVLPLVHVIEAALLVSPEPLTVDRLQLLFGEDAPPREALQSALVTVAERCEHRAYELIKVASGYRFQVRQSLAPWVGRLYSERPARYSRALLETLALVAYRQPVTRGDIEEVRGVAVSTGIMRTLLERNWIHVVGYRDVPGRPALYGTTKSFLDYFGLSTLEQLPPLNEVRDLDQAGRELELALGLDPSPSDATRASGAQDGPSMVAALAPPDAPVVDSNEHVEAQAGDPAADAEQASAADDTAGPTTAADNTATESN